VQEAIARGEIPESIPDVVSNPVIQQLKANLTALDAKLNDLKSKVGGNHPQYVSASAELAGVRTKLTEEMSTLAKTIGNNAILSKKREDQVKASLDAQRGKVLEMKKVRDDLAVLLREAENSQRAYDGAQARMTQTKLESQTTQTNVMVINEAVEPIEPSSPKMLLNTMFAIVIGVFLAVGLALLREMFDRIVRSEADLAETLGAPVLGVLGGARRSWRGRRNTIAPVSRATTS
jgi:uncharacterized protein involved in exopolysaccharide biosynthesis